MGIQGLSKLLGDNAPGCIKPQKFENYFGRKIAVDASMHIYQFMISVGRSGDQLLTNEAGDVTSHLQARFGYRFVVVLLVPAVFQRYHPVASQSAAASWRCALPHLNIN